MKLNCLQSSPAEQKSDALIVGIFEDLHLLQIAEETLLKSQFDHFWAMKDFKGKTGETAVIYIPNHATLNRILLVGLGKRNKADLENLRRAGGALARELLRLGVGQFHLLLDTFLLPRFSFSEISQALTEGLILAAYQFNRFKKTAPENERHIEKGTFVLQTSEQVKEAQQGIDLGKVVSEAANFTRDLQNLPGNELTPTRLSQIIADMAKSAGLQYSVLEKSDMEKLEMEALLSVARGSAEPPKLIVLEHRSHQSELETVVLVGKGVTFDSGGISIKPSEKMEEMKFDMSGAAAVAGVMKAVALLDLPLHVVGLMPAAENLPGAAAMKPGDIVKASSGATIEIVNTDAEGRMILADALTYAKRFNPDTVVDLATLTGACVIALGQHASGLMGNDQPLLDQLQRAGEKCGERLWQLPLWENYREDIKSDFADMKNSAGRPAGAITAAAFLSKFAEEYVWAHIDIAGTAWLTQKKDYFEKGGTGMGVRLLVQFLRDRVEAN
ncbi:MAG: leucyl aminopeptidase [bacterium]